MKILIADDDEQMRRAIHAMISFNYECQILEAATGKQAKEIAEQEKPDLILMDQDMPELPGYAAMKEIRRLQGLEDVPFVMVTADYAIQENQEMDNLQKCSFLPKPFSKEQLLSTIRQAGGKKLIPKKLPKP